MNSLPLWCVHTGNSGKLEAYDLSHHNHSRSGLSLHHHRRAVAKRAERRHFRRLRRPGQSDGIRSAGRGQRAFQGHNVVGGGIHDHFHRPCRLCQQAQRPDLSFAGDQISACEDAACSEAESSSPNRSAKIKFLQAGSAPVPSVRRARNCRSTRPCQHGVGAPRPLTDFPVIVFAARRLYHPG
jgi:hypothetical protein